LIPFNRPFLAGQELEYVRQAIDSGHTSGNGNFSRRCQELLETLLNAQRVLLATSCTHALEMAAILLNFRDGDEVIIPSFTFVSTASAFVMHGATPVFADIRPDTLNLDENLLETLITPRTRAIVPVHYAGVGCEMDVILNIAARHGLTIVEDNAHGLLGKYRSRPLGTFGTFGTLSFHETKNFSCGEGGALVLNDAAYNERAEIVREKGTNRSRFFRGQVDKYTWVDLGSSYLPSDLLAAHLLAQLEERERIHAARRRIWERYSRELGDWALARQISLPTVPDHCEQSYHMFYLLMPSAAERERLIAGLLRLGVHAVFHYQPLHTSPMGKRLGWGECPVTEDISDRLVRLPFYTGMSREEQDRVIEAVSTFE
jgi:dTDP-4-amino-4,6-dideoxygalactose transaminase